MPPAWDIPRQTGLTPQVPIGALCVAIRQLVLFPRPTPTGWRQVGQTAFQLFRPDHEEAFVLRSGDEVEFVAVSPEQLAAYAADSDGGATCETLS